jgi:hypothetical protein
MSRRNLYPLLPKLPLEDRGRKRHRNSSQEPESQSSLRLFAKKKMSQLNSTEPASRPPAPTISFNLDDEQKSQRKRNLASFLSRPSGTKRQQGPKASIEKDREIDHILNTSSRRPYKMIGLDDRYNSFNAFTADKKIIGDVFQKLNRHIHPGSLIPVLNRRIVIPCQKKTLTVASYPPLQP